MTFAALAPGTEKVSPTAMRRRIAMTMAGLVLTAAILPACQVVPIPGPAVRAAPARGAAPVLQSVTLRYNVRAANGTVISVVPDLHFTDADGDAVLVKRELVETSGPEPRMNVPPSAPIGTPAAAQKKGAVVSGGWVCGKDQYYTTIRAQLLDANGNLSNSLQYTIHCNGG
jgi:hypothetical protein